MLNSFDLFYKINNNIINNYNIYKRNFYKLQNLCNVKNSNEIIIKYINNIIDNNLIFDIYKCPNHKFLNDNDGIYIGETKNNKKDGKGIKNFKQNDELLRKKYEGDWKNDKMEGRGMLYLNNGNKYEGHFNNDLKEGKGIYYFNNGDRYEGDWKNNDKEGKGIFHYNNGNIYEGDWKNNKKKEKEYLLAKMENMKVNLKKAYLTEKEYVIIIVEINMMGIGLKIKNMVKG